MRARTFFSKTRLYRKCRRQPLPRTCFCGCGLDFAYNNRYQILRSAAACNCSMPFAAAHWYRIWKGTALSTGLVLRGGSCASVDAVGEVD